MREIPNVGRDDLAILFSQLNLTRGVEVGTEYGEYAETLLKANPNLHLDCVDPYHAYSNYKEHLSQTKLDVMYHQTMFRLRNYDVSFIREFSVDGACRFADKSLDFIYLDGNHSLPYIIADLHAWIPKVRKSGIISGHDFIRRNNSLRYQCHVVEAVHAWTQCYMINPWFTLGTKAEIPGQKREAIRSFMWIKQ